MGLPSEGVVPTTTPTAEMPSQLALAQFFGPKQKSGFSFENHGNPAYEMYVRELHRRVLQKQFPISWVLPFHFARGLVAEAVGMPVAWAEFAYKQIHPHQSHSGKFRILPEFENISVPLPPLIVVRPRGNFQVWKINCTHFRRMLVDVAESYPLPSSLSWYGCHAVLSSYCMFDRKQRLFCIPQRYSGLIFKFIVNALHVNI